MSLLEINDQIRALKTAEEDREFLEHAAQHHPFDQFLLWFAEALAGNNQDPTAMVLATIDMSGLPDTRIVLLKELVPNQFIFYTSYASKKAQELAHCSMAAVNFYWPAQSRQVRLRGVVEKIPAAQSDAYFATRSRAAQLGTHAWIQSDTIQSRQQLEDGLQRAAEKYAQQAVPRPTTWGGYTIIPFEYEFFQARYGRAHDRLLYTLCNDVWEMHRLAP